MRLPGSSRHSSAHASGRGASSRNKARLAAQQQVEVGSYISDMSAELARMAGGAKLPMLAYFLNLARVEAEFVSRKKEEN